MQIYGPTQLHGPQPLKAPHQPRVQPSGPTTSSAISDELHISDNAAFVDLANQLPEIRQGRVDAIRSALASGTYDLESRLDGALDNLLDEIG